MSESIHTWLISAIILTLWSVGAHGAEFSLVDTGTPITLVVVRGEIEHGDGDKFLEISENTERAAILFESPGGTLTDGLLIGRAIHARRFSTGVAPNTACASACALAWIAGSPRFMDPSALVGFHAAFIEKDGVRFESGAANALIGAYLFELGLRDDAIIFATSASPDGINWLTAEAANRAGIPVTFLTTSGEQAEAGKPTPLKLPSGFRWIVIKSATSVDGLQLRYPGLQIVRTRNGYFAAVLGPYTEDTADAILRSNDRLPGDAFLSSGKGFVAWAD